jgi:hypothetical protein
MNQANVKIIDGRPVMTKIPNEPGRYPVTYAAMQSCGPGIGTRYIIYRCKLYVSKYGKPFVRVGEGKAVGSVTLEEGTATGSELLEMAKARATAEYPAFYWPELP